MDDLKQAKLKQFVSDVAMSEAVYGVLLDAFLKPTDYKDVGLLAASRLSVDSLAKAWKDLQKFQAKEEVENKAESNVGL